MSQFQNLRLNIPYADGANLTGINQMACRKMTAARRFLLPGKESLPADILAKGQILNGHPRRMDKGWGSLLGDDSSCVAPLSGSAIRIARKKHPRIGCCGFAYSSLFRHFHKMSQIHDADTVGNIL